MKLLTKNKKAYFNYQILETFEAGIVLEGQEVKSVKQDQINLKGAYVTIANHQAYLLNAHIAPYKFANLSDYDPRRTRKLLLHKKEIDYLIGKSKEKGITILPLKVYLKKGFVKLEIGIARGKKKYDKREAIKKREAQREIQRVLKRK
jgi:SsrA-binding protein